MNKKVKLIIPKFTSEREDARWHDRHRRQLEAAFLERVKAGDGLTLKEALARIKLRPVTIRLANEDIEAARKLAARKGIGYQTYIKLLLREALERESKRR